MSPSLITVSHATIGHIRINPSKRILCEPAGIVLLREYFGFTRTFFQRTPNNGTPLPPTLSRIPFLHSREPRKQPYSCLVIFWLLLVDLFSVFTATPCLSVGFPPPIRLALSYQLWSTVDYLRVQRYYGYCAANTGRAESPFFSPYNPTYTYS